ncbi:uncharacterized protein TrAtP1_012498 [Trichoderma atroviride]|uniref:uncharacterized protein n=1 Tax=Hypocrea atroviridis TaxID=63577 RepID=UPI0033223A2D|nr:hypothetical protein TrAtP1_012498 [Trichoderma atroviride]
MLQLHGNMRLCPRPSSHGMPAKPPSLRAEDQMISSTDWMHEARLAAPSNDSHTVLCHQPPLPAIPARRSSILEAQQRQTPGRFSLTRCAPSNRPDEPIQAAVPPRALHKPKQLTGPWPAPSRAPAGQALGERNCFDAAALRLRLLPKAKVPGPADQYKRGPQPYQTTCGQLKRPARGAKPARHERCQH